MTDLDIPREVARVRGHMAPYLRDGLEASKLCGLDADSAAVASVAGLLTNPAYRDRPHTLACAVVAVVRTVDAAYLTTKG